MVLCAGKKGHHMGDYIPPEELEKFLAKCNDAKAAKAAKATADRAKIQADNVGHRLLSKMGWKEGTLGREAFCFGEWKKQRSIIRVMLHKQLCLKSIYPFIYIFVIGRSF